MNQRMLQLMRGSVAAVIGSMAMVPSISMGAVIEYSDSLPRDLSAFFPYHPNDVGPRNIFTGDFDTITVPQFDPALGTLNSIDIIAQASLSYQMDVSGTGVIDPNLPASISVAVGYGAFIDVTASIFGSQEFTATGSCTRIPGVDLNCFGQSSGMNTYSETATLMPWMGQLFDQFIGNGMTSAVGLDVILYENADSFTFDNYINNPADLAQVDVFLTNGFLTVRYNYTPVPLPSAIVLFGAGLLSMGGYGWRRRTGA